MPREARATTKASTQGKQGGGQGDCPRCHGHHPECKECPNSAATAEDGFDVSAHSKERRPGWYDFMKRGNPCGGFRHVARHHEPILKDEARKDIETWKATNPQAAKPQGGKGKGKKGKHRDQRLGMSDHHDDNRDRALKLLETLLVTTLTDPGSSVMTIARTNGVETLLPTKLKLFGGFNRRAFVWVGPARVEHVFDTGSTHSSIDHTLLKQLILEKSTCVHVHDIVNIEPLECSSMIEGSMFTTSTRAILDVIFKEGNGGFSDTKRLGFGVFKNSCEDLLLGHPSLCELGYVPTKESISLIYIGIEFGTIIPPEGSSAPSAALRCVTNEHLEVAGNGPSLRTVEVVVPPEFQQGDGWLASCGTLPTGVELCEGPVAVNGLRTLASMLVSQDCVINPSVVIAAARPMTTEDFRMLRCMQAAEAEQEHLHELLERCKAEALVETNGKESTRVCHETFLESTYRKKGSSVSTGFVPRVGEGDRKGMRGA